MSYGDVEFDLFAANIASPLFQRICAGALEVSHAHERASVSAVRDTVASVSSDQVSQVRITGHRRHRPIRNSRRVIMSSQSVKSASPELVQECARDALCVICGMQEGGLIFCQGGGGCTLAFHTKCLRRVLNCCCIYRCVNTYCFITQDETHAQGQVAVRVLQKKEKGTASAGQECVHVRTYETITVLVVESLADF